MKTTNAALNAAISKATNKLEPRETTNPRHRAPIPLYPEPTESKETSEKIKLKLRKDPTKGNSATYEKEYILFDGMTTEEYCQFRAIAAHYFLNAGIDTVSAKIAAISQLTTGNALENWNTAIQLFKDDNGNQDPTTDDELQAVMEAFAINYASDSARQEQKRFMNRTMSKPKDMSVQVYWMRLNAMNRMLPYLPGTGPKFPKDQLRDMLVHAMPQWQRDLMTTSNFKWDDPAKKDSAIIQYLEKLRLIESVRENSKKKPGNNKKPPHKSNENANNSKHKFGGGGKQCNFCKKFGHIEAECRKKKAIEAKKKQEEQNEMETEELHSIEALIETLPCEDDQEEI